VRPLCRRCLGLGLDARPRLYIASGSDTRVALAGRALCVQREQRAEQFFPLPRLSRVHSSTQVSWCTEALLACAEQGISVIFVSDAGEITARLLGRPGERDELLWRFEELLMLPQAEALYGRWISTSRARIAYWASARLGAPAAPAIRATVAAGSSIRRSNMPAAAAPSAPANGCARSPTSGRSHT
jgi:hypothetical protein